MDVNDFDLGSIEIKGVYSYVDLQKNAEKKLMFSVSHYVKSFIFIMIVLGGLIIISSLLAIGTSIVPILGNVVNAFVFWLEGATVLLCGVSLFDIYRKVRRLRDIYNYDLRAAQDKLEKSGFFVEIPHGDYFKFSNVFKIISFYINNFKKYEEEFGNNKKNT